MFQYFWQKTLSHLHLFLNDHVPEVLEGQRLGSLTGDEGLLEVFEGDLARVHVASLRSGEQLRVEGDVVVVKRN